MAVAMQDVLSPPNIDFDFSGSSATTASDDGTCAWNDWSPVVNWDVFSSDHEDFQGLIESMLVDENHETESNEIHDSPCNSESTTRPVTTPVTTRSSEEEEGEEDHQACGEDDFKGLRLVHLLMAAAEALTGSNRELARVILVRLKELVFPTQGTNMERLAAYFTDALQGLLDGVSVQNKHHHHHHNTNTSGSHKDNDVGLLHHHHHGLNQTDVLAAFQLLQDMSPYVKFGHFTANQAILEAVAHDRRVHILDYDIMEGVQWASLIQSLASRKEGPPTPHLRITALTRGGSARKSLSSVQETGRRLTAFAASLGQPFSFQQCRLDSDESFRPTSVKLVRGEALVINCMLHFPHSNHGGPGSVISFLSRSRELNPRLVTLAEEETARPAETGGFVGRFMDSLHHYSAVYDSLEAGFPMQTRARGLVERVFLGPRIAGTVARIYRARGEEEWGFSWAEWMNRTGFEPVGLSFSNHCQAKLLLGLFNDGYRVEEFGCNKLVLGWKSRRLLSASVWAPPAGQLDCEFTS